MVKKTRTLLERAQAIFRYIDDFWVISEPLVKSSFQDVGISPREMDRWIDLIQFIQAQPLLLSSNQGKRTYVDVLENKFMLLMKKQFLNPSLSYITRESALLLYFNALLTTEKTRENLPTIDEVVKQNLQLDRPTIRKLAEDALSELSVSE